MKPFTAVAIAVFSLVALLHLLRLALGWDVSVNGYYIPQWASVVGCAIAAGLAIMLWRERRI